MQFNVLIDTWIMNNEKWIMKYKWTLWVCAWEFSGSDIGHVASYSTFFLHFLGYLRLRQNEPKIIFL
jgi:hypothetical protein